MKTAAFLMVFFLLLSEPASSDEGKGKKNGLVGIPFAFYTPETGWAGGLPLIYYYRAEDGDRPNSLNLLTFYTEKKQSVFQLNLDHYFKGQEYHLLGGTSYSDYPNKFYGIGRDTQKSDEEDYISRYAKFEAKLLRRFFVPQFYAGIQGEVEWNRVLDPEDGGLLSRDAVTGSDGGNFVGIGATAVWDSRDNVFFPTSGCYHQLSLKGYDRAFGGDFDFEDYILDFRKYFPLFDSHTMALQGYAEILSGDPPFNRLAKIGGPTLMRGYFNGRFRDKNLLMLQSEYRMPVWKRLGMTGVISAGNVSDKISDFTLEDIKYSYGLGIRYMLDPEEKINLRLDMDWGDGESAMYLVFLEAF